MGRSSEAELFITRCSSLASGNLGRRNYGHSRPASSRSQARVSVAFSHQGYTAQSGARRFPELAALLLPIPRVRSGPKHNRMMGVYGSQCLHKLGTSLHISDMQRSSIRTRRPSASLHHDAAV